MASLNFSNTVKYNEENWTFEILIYNFDVLIETYSIDYPKSLTADMKIMSENILYFAIENSIDTFVPTALLKVTDPQYMITNKLRRQNTCFSVVLRKSNADDAAVKQELNLTFIIKDYRVVTFSQDSITYEIEAELDNSLILKRGCDYATDADVPENPLNIAYEMLKTNNYPLYQTEIEINEGEGSKKVKTRWYPPNVNTKISFITYPNMVLEDALKYLLSIMGNECESPVYLIHNLSDNKSYFASRNHLLRDEWLEDAPSVTKLPFNWASNLIGPSHNMRFVRTHGQLGGSETSLYMSNYTFLKYDHVKREWSSSVFTRSKVNDTLTERNSPDEESLLYRGTVCDLDYSWEFEPYNEQFMNDVMRDLDLYSSNLQFTVNGDLKLDVGEIIDVYEVMAPDSSKKEQFFGKWMISKVRHSFKDKLFKTNFICTRVSFKEHRALKKK